MSSKLNTLLNQGYKKISEDKDQILLVNSLTGEDITIDKEDLVTESDKDFLLNAGIPERIFGNITMVNQEENWVEITSENLPSPIYIYCNLLVENLDKLDLLLTDISLYNKIITKNKGKIPNSDYVVVTDRNVRAKGRNTIFKNSKTNRIYKYSKNPFYEKVNKQKTIEDFFAIANDRFLLKILRDSEEIILDKYKIVNLEKHHVILEDVHTKDCYIIGKQKLNDVLKRGDELTNLKKYIPNTTETKNNNKEYFQEAIKENNKDENVLNIDLSSTDTSTKETESNYVTTGIENITNTLTEQVFSKIIENENISIQKEDNTTNQEVIFLKNKLIDYLVSREEAREKELEVILTLLGGK